MSSARRRSSAEKRDSRSLILILIQILLVLAVPSNAVAQRDAFFSSLVSFYKTLGGTYGDEGPQLVAHLQELSTALERWNDEIRAAEQQLRPQLNGADAQTALQVHTLLASLYMERGRFDEALREFDEDIRIDPRRAAFHRFKGLVHQLQAPRLPEGLSGLPSILLRAAQTAQQAGRLRRSSFALDAGQLLRKTPER